MDELMELGPLNLSQLQDLTENEKTTERMTSDSLSNSEEQLSDIIVHPTANLPLPFGLEENSQADLIFLDPSLGEGKRLLGDKATTIPQLFAVMRQFISPVCGNIGILVEEMLKRGVGINDCDQTTGMTLLHYVVRSGALTEKHSINLLKRLLSSGGDACQRTLYSDMNALHLAVYFDIPQVVSFLLKKCDLWHQVALESLCGSFDYGTSLHIAARCLSCRSAEILLQRGACYNAKDDLGRTPEDCIPTNLKSNEERTKANHIKDLLSKYGKSKPKFRESRTNEDIKPGVRVQILSEKLSNGDKPLTGTLRYVGSLTRSSGEWGGVELDDAVGTNNGSLGGVSYFECEDNHGIFVPISEILLDDESSEKPLKKQRRNYSRKDRSNSNIDFNVGDRIVVAGSKRGLIRFIGSTQFASGIWCGIELDQGGKGRNDGSVAGIRYFTCHPSKGIFAPPSKIKKPKTLGESPGESDANLETNRTSDPGSLVTSPPVTPGQTRRSPSLNRKHHGVTSSALGGDRRRSKSNQRDAPKGATTGKRRQTLKLDMKVDVEGSEQPAFIRFIGTTEFAPGLWIGLELLTASGRNDGSVKGRRYFSCPHKHGVMLRPSRVSYMGVGGESMVPKHLTHLLQDGK